MTPPTRSRARRDVPVSGRNSRARGRRRGRRRGWLAVSLMLALLVPQMPWFGCTAQRRYEILSLFFDGVPDPNAPPPGSDVERDAQGNPIVRASEFAHKPFEDGNCGACHANPSGSFSEFDKVSDDVCLKCHADVPHAYPRMHGPVALGLCSQCHLPHESSVRPLLRDDPAVMCATCHSAELLPPEPPDHFTKRDCLDCHGGHGGTEAGLLRGGWQPATRPATPQATPQATR
jgi:predicted CXXCH cytochrome family protein